MALTHLAFALLILAIFDNSEANKTAHNAKQLDPKIRSNVVQETFLEQKDVLLDMLESKLKEVRDKKKKKNHIEPARDKCQNMLRNIDVKVKISGIGSIGEAALRLKYGNTGKGAININANGISNVGQANVELGLEENALYIPGLSNLFVDRELLDCAKTTKETEIGVIALGATNNDDSKRPREENETNTDKPTLSKIEPTTATTISDIFIPTTHETTQEPLLDNPIPIADVSEPDPVSMRLLPQDAPQTQSQTNTQEPLLAYPTPIVNVSESNPISAGFSLPQDVSQSQITSQPVVETMRLGIRQPIPQAIQQPIPQAIPQPFSQAIPQAIPRAIPQAIPHVIPQFGAASAGIANVI